MVASLESSHSSVTPQFFAPFNASKCLECGLCLTHCPVMSIPLKISGQIIQDLRQPQPKLRVTKKLLKVCQSCFTCSLYCPQQANPTDLILQHWRRAYVSHGLRQRARFYFTHFPNYPNFRTEGITRMTPIERQVLARWARLDPLEGDTLTYPGCNMILTPLLTQNPIFAGLDIRGRLEYCCGETLFRTGFSEQLQEVAARLDRWFSILQPKHLLVLCTAGTNVFRNILPRYGLHYQFNSITSYIEWIWQRLERGDLRITHPLGWRVALQDSCYSKMFGDAYMDLPRKILQAIGCEVIESPACRDHMRCCGIAGGFSVASSYDPFRVRAATCRNLDAFKKLPVDALCVYCSGCLQTFSIAKKLYGKPWNRPIYHIIELLLLAMEEPLPHTMPKTATHMFWGIIHHQFPQLLSRKSFRIPPIPPDPHPDGF